MQNWGSENAVFGTRFLVGRKYAIFESLLVLNCISMGNFVSLLCENLHRCFP